MYLMVVNLNIYHGLIFLMIYLIKTPAEIDDYLFAKYNISDDIRKHIEELLPDFYNIRKGRD